MRHARSCSRARATLRAPEPSRWRCRSSVEPRGPDARAREAPTPASPHGCAREAPSQICIEWGNPARLAQRIEPRDHGVSPARASARPSASISARGGRSNHTPEPGGRAGVFRRDGYTFDAGPTVITAPHLIDELFEMAGRDPREYFRLVPVDPFYRILYDDGSSFDYVADEERLIEQIRAFEPRDVDGYRRLAALSREIFEVGYLKLGDQPFHELRTMLRRAATRWRASPTIWRRDCPARSISATASSSVSRNWR